MPEHTTSALTTIVTSSEIDVTIAAWLHAKQQRSQSSKTAMAYQDTITRFRSALQQTGLDLLSVQDPDHRRQIKLIAQAYAAWSTMPGKQVAAATYNQRLAILSSFYAYAIRAELIEHNPLDQVDRAKVQAYRSAQPLSTEETSSGLASIDRSRLDGKRDYALLAVLLQTGRRLSEVQALTWSSVKIAQGKITLTFHCKGDKVMIDTLGKAASDALLIWLHAYYGRALNKLEKETPLWVSLAKGPSNRQPLGIQAIADVCKRYLGTSKVHTMRHTFAHTMEAAGANVSEIQARLGHESLATTGRYLAQLKQAENRHAEKVAALLGIE